MVSTCQTFDNSVPTISIDTQLYRAISMHEPACWKCNPSSYGICHRTYDIRFELCEPRPSTNCAVVNRNSIEDWAVQKLSDEASRHLPSHYGDGRRCFVHGTRDTNIHGQFELRTGVSKVDKKRLKSLCAVIDSIRQGEQPYGRF